MWQRTIDFFPVESPPPVTGFILGLPLRPRIFLLYATNHCDLCKRSRFFVSRIEGLSLFERCLSVSQVRVWNRGSKRWSERERLLSGWKGYLSASSTVRLNDSFWAIRGRQRPDQDGPQLPFELSMQQ